MKLPDPAPVLGQPAAVAEWITKWVTDHVSMDVEIEPLAVQRVGDFAVLHVTYRDEATTKAGVTETFVGRWTVTAVKEDGDWRFLTWTYLQREPWPFSGKE